MKDSLIIFTEGAKVNFQVYGYLVPVFAGVLDGEPQMFAVSWEDRAQKEAFAQKIKTWIAENRLTEYVMVVEAWTAPAMESVQEWMKTHESLENHPERKEIVLVQYCSPDEEIWFTADIIRGTISVPMIGKWEKFHRKVKYSRDDFSARFQGLFLKGKAGQN
jgi:hypothetical protein